MRIVLYSPYFPKHIGGGEKYLLDTAMALAEHGEVSLAVPDADLDEKKRQAIYKKYARFMGHSIEKLQLIDSPLGTSASFWEKLLWTKQFDLLYFVSDGSWFMSLARRSVMHIQTPLLRGPLSFMEQLKKLTWQFVNTNSAFTKQVVESNWGVRVNAVHHPMVDVLPLQKLAGKTKKHKIILHVGRFFRHQHSKRQNVLVRFFKTLRKKHPKETKGWKLVLIGSVEDEQYAAQVRRSAKGAPISVIHSVTRQALNQWYAKAALYWHATGFGLSETSNPASMEHFGISTVEAMAAGAVPVVIGQGGQPEVLGPELADLLWTDEKSCLEKTVKLMNNTNARSDFSKRAIVRSQTFGPQAFEENIRQMLVQLGLV